MSVQQTIPGPASPVTDKNGVATLPWMHFFRALWTRTGGASGALTPPGGKPVPVAAPPSPLRYTAPGGGVFSVSGNGVQSVALLRAGTNIQIGRNYGPIPLLTGDELLVVYIGSPIFTWLPN